MKSTLLKILLSDLPFPARITDKIFHAGNISEFSGFL